jgi:peptidyl-prolyl cis-trans isomerase C
MFAFKLKNILILAVLLLAAAACSAQPSPTMPPEQATPTQASSPEAAVLPTDTTVPSPTPTPEPLALLVNGEGLPLAEFEAELRQLEEAHESQGKIVPPKEQSVQVVNYFVETLLLAQGAAQAGYQVEESALQVEIDRLGGEQALADLAAERGILVDTLRASLARQMAAAWQRDQVIGAVPQVAEQVHVRQILAQEESVAKRAYDQVHVPGVNFAAQAYRYDPVTGGDLGWFPRGYLLQPEVEETAFQLEPGQISPVIQSSVGYHVIQLAAREPSRALSPDVRRVLQHKALRAWLDERRAASSIEILLP